jgi:PHS family inorganic phosphate transporter-like MFS transporter
VSIKITSEFKLCFSNSDRFLPLDGNTLFEPVVLEAAFGSKDDIEDGYTLLLLAVRDSLMISLLSLPGYFMTVVLIGRRTCVCRSLRTHGSSRCNSIFSPCTQTPAYIQMQGFVAMFILYLIIGLYWTSLENIQWLLLVLYAGSFFFANYGPNSTTFLLPSVTYLKECRSTLNGLSAAAGKLGALVGASAFEPAADRWGESSVMITCAIVSLFGFILTRVCVGHQSRH